MADPAKRVAVGGKAVYGARLGILMLEARFPRILGDMGNAETWPFPVLYRVVPGASPDRVVRRRATGLAEDFVAAAKELVAVGADGITTNCGFLSLFQDQIARACDVPVATSALMQYGMIRQLLPPDRPVGIITISAATLSPEHLRAADIPPDAPVVGTETGREFSRVILGDELRLDVVAAEQDILDAGRRLREQTPRLGAILLECTNMAPYARALGAATGVPVFDIYSFITWFHTGLKPRTFGPSGSPLR